jgi:pimeloyl-ACP methyl ester carboxylesterase
MLADGRRLIAPSHPGFGHSDRPAGITTVDDLAYLYLDMMDELDLRDTVVVGISLGAWIAAVIAVKSTARWLGLCLATRSASRWVIARPVTFSTSSPCWKGNFWRRPSLIPLRRGAIIVP